MDKRCSTTFSVKYKTEYGQNVYLMGSLPELGKWGEFKAKLTWSEGHVWSGTLSLPQEHFEYKYVVHNPSTNQTLWEMGRNRHADLRERSSIVLNEIWESFRIHFMIYYPLPEGTIMRINGDPDSLGHWNLYGPKSMLLTSEEKLLPNGGYGRPWEFEITAPNTMETLCYKYTTYNEKENLAIWEREPSRILKVPEKITYDEVIKTKKELGLADFTQIDIPVNGSIEKWDVNFVSNINFDKIGAYPIIIGAYPQHEEDVKILAKNGVTAVLNVQTEIDMKHRGTDLLKMKELYARCGIKLVHFPIHDFNPEDLAQKVRDAGKCLNDLIEEGRIVFVHCTAGMGRAPSTVISYLVQYKKLELEEASNLVKEHRKVVNPNMWSLKKALTVAS